VGIHDDATVNRIKGANYPIATLNERVLCVCACKHVDEVIIGAPLTVTEDMIINLNIKYVVNGSHTVTHHTREYGYTIDVKAAEGTSDDPHFTPKKMGILKHVVSAYPELTTTAIAERVANNRLAFVKRNANRSVKEQDYYAGKKNQQAVVEA